MSTMVKWRDITALCQAAAAEMTDDQPMSSVEDFSLLDSMSAVELMDPKMDQCCGLTGSVNSSELLKFKGSSESGDVSPGALAAVLQILFVYEASFLDGASLLETTHQCIFMWKDSWSNIESNEQWTVQLLLAYSKSLSRSLGHVFNGVLAADIFEDDDFHSTYKEYLGDDYVDSTALEATIYRLLTKLTAESSTNGPSILGYLGAMLNARAKLQSLTYLISEDTRGIITEYSRVMKRNQRSAGSGQPRESVNVSPDAHINQCQDLKSLAAETLAALRTLEAYHKDITAIQQQQTDDNNSNSTVSNEVVSNLTSWADRSDIHFAFNSTLAKLIQISPVRFVNLKSFTESIAYLASICEEVSRVCSVSIDIITANNTPSSTLSFDELLFMCQDLSQHKLHIINRSFFFAIIHTQSENIKFMLQKSMSRRGLPNAVIQCELVQAQWLEQNPFSAAWETLKALCIHRNRLHPRMDQVLSLWGAVANDSMYVDEQFRIQNDLGEVKQQWCSTWALTLSTTMMDMYMSLVVEMDLLNNQELDYFYWYWDYICSTHLFAADKLRENKFQLDKELYEQSVMDAEAVKKASKSNKKNKSKSDDNSNNVTVPIPKPVEPSLGEFLIKGRGHLCRGLFRVSVIALQLQMIDKTENKYLSWSTRFDARFKAFQGVVNPPMLAYGDFLNTLVKGSSTTVENVEPPTDITKLKIDVNTIQSGASVCFQNARKYFDEIRRQPLAGFGDNEVQNEALLLTKVAVANSVSTLKIGQLVKTKNTGNSSNDLKYSLNKSYHKQYPVIEITKK